MDKQLQNKGEGDSSDDDSEPEDDLSEKEINKLRNEVKIKREQQKKKKKKQKGVKNLTSNRKIQINTVKPNQQISNSANKKEEIDKTQK